MQRYIIKMSYFYFFDERMSFGDELLIFFFGYSFFSMFATIL